jgi:threonine dehydrogenase-like Zn-dependent dehydrogenase
MTMELSNAARALWYVGPRQASLRPATLVAPQPGFVRIRTLFSGISRGTERLVFEGRVGETERQRMRAPLQEGDFPFPVKYGYCAVGVVEAGPAELQGRTVFALHPHQDRFVVPIAAVTPIPDGIPARRAVLAANMETALNAVWDSGAGPGDRIVVIGAGLVGMLVATLAAGLPGAEVSLVDLRPDRRALALSLGARFCQAHEMPHDADVVFHASQSGEGLALALAAAGDEARIIELSWFGAGTVAVPLGGAFHSRRLQIISSQVGQIATSRRPRWDYRRRMAKAIALLNDARLDGLITAEVAFDDLPAELPAILAPDAAGLATVIRYA